MQLLFALTLLVSAGLMFIVEPMFAKMALTLLGGSPSVWNTCLVFYQAALLAGYVYAHVSVKWLRPRRQALVHLVLLCLPWLVLPIGIAHGWTPPREGNPVPWLWMLLTVSLGLPFLAVSASAPVLQAWFAETGHRAAKDPYFLYAASNFGSIVGLAAYPLVIESRFTLADQSKWWAAGYGLLMAMIAACAAALWRSRPGQAQTSEVLETSEVSEKPLTLGRRLRWLALAMVPSSLLLGVTLHLSTDIAAVPLLWAIPLLLYLLSFVLVFAQRKLLPHRWAARLQAGSLAVLAAFFCVVPVRAPQFIGLSAFHLLAFFFTALVCHGELAADRPASRHLTEFYLWMSLGGVVGGLFNALVAPMVFRRVVEYPLMIIAACLLRPRPVQADATWMRRVHVGLTALAFVILVATVFLVPREHRSDLVVRVPLVGVAALAAFLLQRRPARFAVALAIVLAVGLSCSGAQSPLYCTRSFFGVLRVVRQEKADAEGKLYYRRHTLMHGSTMHGVQSQRPEDLTKPCAYFHTEGPVGDIFNELNTRKTFAEKGRIGVVGLGTGAIAAYGRGGQQITFFEIDPAVERIAQDPQFFTYLGDCRARGVDLKVRLGDARLTLADEPDREFDVLFIDAFSSDAIPVHLLTREALQLFFAKLAETGLLAVHITNRHLDLEPVLSNLADDLGVVARIREDRRPGNPRGSPSTWVVLARHAEDIGGLQRHAPWRPATSRSRDRLWTDDFSSVVSVFRWDLRPSWLPWWKGPDEASDKPNGSGGRP